MQAGDDDRKTRLLTMAGEALFERVVDDDALWVSDRYWQLLRVAPHPLPASRSALIARLHPDDRERGAALVAQADNADVLLGRLQLGDGQWHWVRQRTQVHQLADGRTVVLGALSDVDDTERQRASPTLERVAPKIETRTKAETEADADRADRLRVRWVAQAGHELRTPLNSLLGLVDLVRRAELPSAQQRHLDLAAQSGRAMLRVLDDMLNLASIGGAPAPLHDEWFDLDDVVCDAIRMVTPQMGWHDFSVVYDHDGDVAQVRSNAGRLRQIVTNLIVNAAKVTRQGHIGVSLHAQAIDEAHCAVSLQVEDTGPGIAADRLARLFEPFSMADHAQRQGGTGLGLSLVHAMVTALGGRIDVHSTVGQGTVFHIQLTLPSVREAPAPAAPTTACAWLVYAPPFVKGGEWLARRLARFGGASRTFESVDAAVAHAANSAPELLIVAAHSVHATLDLQRLAEALPRVAKVLVSRPDWQRPDLEQRALDLHFSVVTVPVARRDLRLMLGLAPSARPPMPAAVAPVQLSGRVLLVEDNEVGRLVAEQILLSLNLSVHTADSGEAAVLACAAQAPDLVLMDLQMPGIDGKEAARRIMAAQVHLGQKRFPIVAYTADASPDVAAECLAAGMVGLLKKPSDVDTLRQALAQWVGYSPVFIEGGTVPVG